MAALSGFIKLHRKLTAWGWYDDDVVKSVFLHLLLTANFKESTWHDITLKPGQLVTTLNKLSEELQHSKQQTRTALDKLKATHEITIKSTHRFSLITIVNWEEYQSTDGESNTVSNTVNNTLSTHYQHTEQHSQQHQRKKYKNKEYKNIINKGVYYIAKSDEKNCYGKYQNVLLTPTEYEEVYDLDNGVTLDRFSERLYTRGYKYDDHYQAILTWYAEDKNKQIKHEPVPDEPEQKKSASYDMDEFLKRAEQLPVYVSQNGADEN